MHDFQTVSNLSKDGVRPKAFFLHPNNKPIVLNKTLRDTALSVAFWLKPSHILTHSGSLFGEDSVFYFRYLANRTIQFNHYLKRDVETKGILTNNQWQHLGFTLSKKGRLQVFFNGERILSDSIAPNWWMKKGKVVLGHDPTNINAEGWMDKVMVWNREISAAEMQKVYRATILLPALSDKLEAYFPFNANLEDQHSPALKVLQNSGVKLEKDPEKGVVARFSYGENFLVLDKVSCDNQLTVAAWVKPMGGKNIMAIAGSEHFSLRMKRKGQRVWFNVPMQYENESATCADSFADWVHIVISLNYNHKIAYYVNGRLINTDHIDGATGTEGFVTIGKSIWGNYFVGRMSQFAMWSRTLDASEIKDIYNGKKIVQTPKKNSHVFAYLGISAMLLLLSIVVFRIKPNGSKKPSPQQVPKPEATHQDLPKQNAIYLLDSLRAFDADGNDISNEFTPTIARIFALLVLYPVVYQRRINSSQLSDILWENDDAAQKKNKRSTNMHRLRTILKAFEDVKVQYQNKEWYVQSPGLFVDVLDLHHKISCADYDFDYNNLKLCKKLQDRSFDNLRQQRSEMIIRDLQLHCTEGLRLVKWTQLRKLSELWLSLDSISEAALKYHITACIALGDKQKALRVFNTFSAEYSLLLNEKTTLNFVDCNLVH